MSDGGIFSVIVRVAVLLLLLPGITLLGWWGYTGVQAPFILAVGLTVIGIITDLVRDNACRRGQ